MTTDTAAAARFYSAVVGWAVEKAGNTTAGGMDYTLFKIPGFDMGTAGMMALTPPMQAGGARPAWIGYVFVDSVEAKTAQVSALGGAVHMEPTDIPGIGRFSVVADPHGATFYLFKPIMPEGPMPEMPKQGSPGTFGWNELNAGNLDEAFAFYSGLFGWTKSMAVPMGAMGVYQLFANEGRDIGGMMKKHDQVPLPFWGFYITVDAIDAAVERVKENGGTITNGPHPVPGDAWIVEGIDPQGAVFALTAGKR
ncbi:VOC family protein [Rhizobium sp. C4]|uniref:VOC family protein n=1 Tax=Rhizobium sp. C4 TaxID=1349800 RepID=UPI001E51C4F7|nr:VOC family protein [Rhizobium sp. C4]MCD2173145.1 VOC family protein [Rhizobium sp. C4]